MRIDLAMIHGTYVEHVPVLPHTITIYVHTKFSYKRNEPVHAICMRDMHRHHL